MEGRGRGGGGGEDQRTKGGGGGSERERGERESECLSECKSVSHSTYSQEARPQSSIDLPLRISELGHQTDH